MGGIGILGHFAGQEVRTEDRDAGLQLAAKELHRPLDAGAGDQPRVVHVVGAAGLVGNGRGDVTEVGGDVPVTPDEAAAHGDAKRVVPGVERMRALAIAIL